MALKEIADSECKAEPGKLRVVLMIDSVLYRAGDDVITKGEAAARLVTHSKHHSQSYIIFDDKGDKVSLDD